MMKNKKTSLISYLIILSLILTSALPSFAQETILEEADVQAQLTFDPSEYDVNNPDSIMYETDIDQTFNETAQKFDENVKQTISNVGDAQNKLYAADSNSEESAFTDTSAMSDEEFFGVWDMNSESWKIEGKLNYDYDPGLAEVERLVKFNSYSLAKDALLDYYKNRNHIARADFTGSLNWAMNMLWMKDTYAYNETPITFKNITNQDEYQQYNIDLESDKSTSTFLISSVTKTNDMVCIGSRESEYSPLLIITKIDGSTVTLNPVKDTYIRGLDDMEDYSTIVYGDAPQLYVKDSYYQTEDGTYKPYSSKTRRAYIAFNPDEYPDEIKSMQLQIYAKIVPEEDQLFATETNHELIIFSAYNKSWDEVVSPNNDFLPMTWKNYKLGHYSWNGIPGGYDWGYPDNVVREFINSNTRFNNIESLARASVMTDNQDYMKKAIADVLDFIRDTNGSIVTGWPVDRDIEASNRTRVFPGIFAAFLESDMFNSEALTAILKWVWEEMTFMYNGAGVLYIGATDLPQTNNYAETNRGLWHTSGTIGMCTYFPEFTDRSNWKHVADKRLYTVSHVLVNDDGCYQEPTFSYALNMLNYYMGIYKALQDDPGSEVPDWFLNRVGNFARYMAFMSAPNHIPPKVGDGAAGNTVNAIKKFLNLKYDPEIEYIVTDGAEGVEPKQKSAYFDSLKIVSSRTDWSPSASMLYMLAKNGGSHAHRDSLHIGFYTGSRDLIADTGNTSYDPDHPHFPWQRTTTRSHNTIEIDGTPQRGSSELYNSSKNPAKWNGEASLTLYPSDTVDRIVAWTDATVGFRHYRNVSYIKNKNFIIVSDKVVPSDSNTHTYTQNWHTSALDPSNPVIDDITKIARTNYPTGSNILIAQANTDNVNLTIESGYSVNSPNPTEYFSYSQTDVGDIIYNTVLYPSEVGSTSNITIQNVDTGVDPTIASAMDVNIFKNEDDVLNVFYYNTFEETPVMRSFNGYKTNASNVTIQQDVTGIPSFLSMYNGTLVERDGGEVISSDLLLDDIEIQFDGTDAIITSKDEDITNAKLVVLTPGEIENVTINGVDVNYIYTDNKLYINNDDAVDFTTDSGYYVKFSATDAKGKTYPIIVSIPSSSVETGTLSKPTCTLNEDKFVINIGNATLNSCAKIMVASHSKSDVKLKTGTDEITVDNVISTGSSQEHADSNTAVGSPVLERAREDLIIWTKDATQISVEVTKIEYSSGGNVGGPSKKPLPTAGENPEDTSKDDDNDQTADVTKPIVFEDCADHWAKEDISHMYAKGYVNGISDTMFAPDTNVTRAEFAAMAVRILKLEMVENVSSFDDVSVTEWYAPVVEAAYRAGIIKGSSGMFRPNDNITREEMAVILMRVYNLNKEYSSADELQFADNSEISEWAKEAVASTCTLGLVNGIGDNTFAPKENTTRAQAATVFKRLLDIE